MADRDIFVVTAPKVGDTGKVSYMFMMHVPREHSPMPQDWGYFYCGWDGTHHIFVFNGKKGQHFAAGMSDDSDLAWNKEVLSHLPSCTILMNEEAFKFWKKRCEETSTEYRLYQHDKPLLTDDNMPPRKAV